MGKFKSTLLFTWMLLFIQVNLYPKDKSNANKLNSDTIQIYFRFDDAHIDKSYRSNINELKKLDSLLLRQINDLDSITITSFASIEGDQMYNNKLSALRSNEVKEFMLSNHLNEKRNLQIKACAKGENWDGLLAQAYERKWIPDRLQLIAILEDPILSQTEKKRQIYTLKNGEVYDYLNEYVFWRLRNTASIILWYKPKLETIVPEGISLLAMNDGAFPATQRLCSFDKSKSKLEHRKLLFALKSNLLFDLASFINIEMELPIKKHLSIAGEWVFPFWKIPKSDLTLNLLYGKLDFKFWLGDRLSKPVMIGWFCDVYGGYGKYDFQPFLGKGVQGHFLNIGLGAGYAHKIGRNLRMEYAIGLGYLRSDYQKYQMTHDTKYGDIKIVIYPWKKSVCNLVAPTKLAVSLVWIINKEKFI